jgi:hypothetical protein
VGSPLLTNQKNNFMVARLKLTRASAVIGLRRPGMLGQRRSFIDSAPVTDPLEALTGRSDA